MTCTTHHSCDCITEKVIKLERELGEMRAIYAKLNELLSAKDNEITLLKMALIDINNQLESTITRAINADRRTETKTK
jgi:hypothetical protein